MSLHSVDVKDRSGRERCINPGRIVQLACGAVWADRLFFAATSRLLPRWPPAICRSVYLSFAKNDPASA